MSGALQAVFQNQRSFIPPDSDAIFTRTGDQVSADFTWVAPAGVTSVAVLAIGYGSSSGGGLGWRNAVAVTPGNSYTAHVSGFFSGSETDPSFFIDVATVRGGRGADNIAGTFTGDGGGNGGVGSRPWGAGGGGGYSGNGGAGRAPGGGNGFAGAGGGGGGGANVNQPYAQGGASGGGTGLYGQGSNGAGGILSGVTPGGGGGGSGGQSAGSGQSGGGNQASGGIYGGGGTSGNSNSDKSGGAVRIVWAAGTRGTPSFPSTNVGV